MTDSRNHRGCYVQLALQLRDRVTKDHNDDCVFWYRRGNIRRRGGNKESEVTGSVRAVDQHGAWIDREL
jgi:hypothetical protein